MIVGTRGSRLALAQTEMFVSIMNERFPQVEVNVKRIRTTGDEVTSVPLHALGGYGAFVKELDQRIVSGEVDVAVNSLKDMPAELSPGTHLAALLPRAPVEDIIVPDIGVDELARGARVGTSSVRRRSLLLSVRPDLDVVDIRGNVPTRIRKLEEGGYDAILLARAGVQRLGLEVPHRVLPPSMFVPAVGQGAIAIVCREGSEHLGMLSSLDHLPTRFEVEAERRVLSALGGGCSVPIGVNARYADGKVEVSSVVLSEDGSREARESLVAKVGDIAALDSMAERLKAAMGG